MNVRQVGKKIKSFGNVKKITNAMQLVSAVKMRKAQLAATEGRPYQELLEEAIHNLTAKGDAVESVYLTKASEKNTKKLMIVVTSNKGLCGSFNFNLIRAIAKDVNKENAFLTIGKKGTGLISHLGGSVVADFSSLNLLDSVSAVFQLALDGYLKGTYGEVVLVYNKFISTLKSEPVVKTILPVSMKGTHDDKDVMSADYMVEPSPQTVLDALLKSFIEEQIRFAIVESEAGEHSARMVAMKNATDNASNVIYNLTLLKNKLRQQSITYELLDMITAKESVEAN